MPQGSVSCIFDAHRPVRARRLDFAAGACAPRGQIDFYDQPALIGAAGDAIVTYFARDLRSLQR
jgi:hypothetical protein